MADALEHAGISLHIKESVDDPTWFRSCELCTACLVLLSKNYMCGPESDLLEGQLTFAKDYGKQIVRVIVDAEYHVLTSRDTAVDPLRDHAMKKLVEQHKDEVSSLMKINSSLVSELEALKAELSRTKSSISAEPIGRGAAPS